MNLTDTLKDQLDKVSDDELNGYMEARKEPEFKIGEPVHYWNKRKADGLERIGRLQCIAPDTSLPFMVNNIWWANVSHPIDYPEIRIPFNGTECPDYLKGKMVTRWYKNGTAVPKRLTEDYLPNIAWDAIDFIMVHRDE